MIVSLNESALLLHQENVLLATSETCFQSFLWNQFLTLCSLASQVNTITEKKWWSKIVVLASISVLLLKSCPVVCITLNYPK